MTQQIETQTVVANITLAGTAKSVITGGYITGSPVTVTFSVLLADNEDAVALAARTAIALNSAVSDQYQISGDSDQIVLTDRFHRANDTSLNITIENVVCTGITDDTTSVDTTAGSGLTNAYATLAEFKQYATVRGGTATTDVNDDRVIEFILNKASRYIDEQTGRKFWIDSADVTKYFTPEQSDILYIDELGATPTSIATDEEGDRTYSTTIASTDYDLEPDNATSDEPWSYIEIIPSTSAYFPTIRRGVRIVGKWGWPTTPEPIKTTCLSIALNVYQSRTGQSNAGNINVTAAGVVIRPQDVSATDGAVIDHYRKLVP